MLREEGVGLLVESGELLGFDSTIPSICLLLAQAVRLSLSTPSDAVETQPVSVVA